MTPRKIKTRRPPRRAGFTLVELLVALGLVSILLLMFAQVFQVATGTMSTQRGLMENDQRARALTTVITNDLNNRTMQNVIPFLPGEANEISTFGLNAAIHGFDKRQGFLSISENDPTIDTDDVLHFTAILSTQTSSDATTSEAETFHGRSGQILPTTIPSPDYRLYRYRNQPELDDSITYGNLAGASRKAEIVYFVRNGNLYRRVMLIRTPLDPTQMEVQPNTLDYTDPTPPPAENFFDPDLPTSANPYYVGEFWRDFDYAARFKYKSLPAPPNTPEGASFIGAGPAGVNPLSNLSGGLFPIAKPENRFGHHAHTLGNLATRINVNIGPDASFQTADDSVGNPCEYAGGIFIGRFTHEETSHSNFNYPHLHSQFDIDPLPGTGLYTPLLGQRINDGNPMKFLPDRDSTTGGVIAIVNPLADANGNGVIDQFEAGEIDTRRGEDLLLSNVHGFDVKVWDEIVGDYVDIGHTLSGQVSTFPGPVTMPGDFNQLRNRRTSYGPQVSNNRMFDTWHPEFNANNDLDGMGLPLIDANDSPPFVAKNGYPLASPNGHRWITRNYNLGEVVVPTAPTTEYVAYRLIGPSNGVLSGPTEPDWALRAPLVGQRFNEVDGDDTTPLWIAIDNRKRLKSLKITVRYLDVSSDQMRQVTLIQSLVD